MNNQLIFIKLNYILILYTINQYFTLGIKSITMKCVNMVTSFLNVVWKFSFEIHWYGSFHSPKRHKIAMKLILSLEFSSYWNKLQLIASLNIKWSYTKKTQICQLNIINVLYYHHHYLDHHRFPLYISLNDIHTFMLKV